VAPTASTPPIRALVFSATAGFRHDSIATAREVMASIGPANSITPTATEDLSAFTASNLANYDVVMFAMTSGELPFTAEHKNAILAFVNNGKGFVGVHSATDTLREWADYGLLVGAYVVDHPWTQPARVIVEDATHPATGIRDSFQLEEEFYVFGSNPRGRVHVLLRLDAASVGTSGDFPLAWAQSFGSGRAYYNALGHFPSTWRDARFQSQMIAAIKWAAGR
jgi:type 1 glutamine amidotransferase